MSTDSKTPSFAACARIVFGGDKQSLTGQKFTASFGNVEKACDVRVFYGDESKALSKADYAVTAVVSVGSTSADVTAQKVDQVRAAGAKATQVLKELGATTIAFDASDFVDAEYEQAVAEGALLATWKYDWLRKDKKSVPKIELMGDANSTAWQAGLNVASAQNLARELMEMPANMLTPTAFCERAQKEFKGYESVKVNVYDEAWAQERNMNAFLSVTQGTAQPAKFLEVIYTGASDAKQTPLALVGKGVCFDLGGNSIKPSAKMDEMRADMGGGAVLLSTVLAVARAKMPINIVLCIPLVENLVGPTATKPGDIVTASNGLTIAIDNTDAEGRLILSDALHYIVTTYRPKTVIDAATLTGSIIMALGQWFTGAFTNSDALWQRLHAAGEKTGDQFWRMPLSPYYERGLKKSNADLCNIGGREGGSCVAAAFLANFVEGVHLAEPQKDTVEWAHLDIASVMSTSSPYTYNTEGMSGRPVRTLVQFIQSSLAQ